MSRLFCVRGDKLRLDALIANGTCYFLVRTQESDTYQFIKTKNMKTARDSGGLVMYEIQRVVSTMISPEMIFAERASTSAFSASLICWGAPSSP